MTELVMVSASLAACAFFVWKTISRIVAIRETKIRDEKREKLKDELEDEILNGGSLARIGELYRRLQDYED